MSFVLFSLLNIVTSFFLEAAMAAAEERRKQDTLHELQKMLNLVDDNRDRYVSKEEIDRHLNDDSMKASLKKLDLDISAVNKYGVFDLLDEDHSGGVTAQELVQGCLRLRGPARAVDLALLSFEI